MKPAHILVLLGLVVLALLAFLPTRETAPQSAGMKTLSKPARAKPARKVSRAASIPPAPSKTFSSGYARAVLKVKEGVDLTLPTLPVGKYL